MDVGNILHTVPQRILDESRAFFYQRGLEGCEGTALWVGHPSESGVLITRLFIPEQIATKSRWGVAVDLTEKAHYTLTDNLHDGERFYVRIHSHPREAYHSARDDENPILTHQGALSIVVPDFAKRRIVLEECAIYRLVHGRGWLPLAREMLPRLFQVIP